MDTFKQERAVWFFTAYHIIREGAERAYDLCCEGKGDEAAEVLAAAREEAERFFYDSIDKYIAENPMSREELEQMFGKSK